MRRLTLLFAVLLVLPLLGSDSPKEYDDSTVSDDPLVGEWTRATLRIDGNERPLDDGWAYTFRRDRYSVRVGRGTPAETGTCRIERGSPNRLTTTQTGAQPPAGTHQFLFRVENGTLFLGYYNGAVGRPRGWDDPALHVSTFKRVRK